MAGESASHHTHSYASACPGHEKVWKPYSSPPTVHMTVPMVVPKCMATVVTPSVRDTCYVGTALGLRNSIAHHFKSSSCPPNDPNSFGHLFLLARSCMAETDSLISPPDHLDTPTPQDISPPSFFASCPSPSFSFFPSSSHSSLSSSTNHTARPETMPSPYWPLWFRAAIFKSEEIRTHVRKAFFGHDTISTHLSPLLLRATLSFTQKMLSLRDPVHGPLFPPLVDMASLQSLVSMQVPHSTPLADASSSSSLLTSSITEEEVKQGSSINSCGGGSFLEPASKAEVPSHSVHSCASISSTTHNAPLRSPQDCGNNIHNLDSMNCCGVVQPSHLQSVGINCIQETGTVVIPTLLEPYEPQECEDKWAVSSSSNSECYCYSNDSAEEGGEGEWEEEGEEEEEEEEEDDVTNEFDGESESEGEIEFSDESDIYEDKTPLHSPHAPLVCKEPTIHKCLLKLCSEESGFGENSFSESYSDGEWEEEEDEVKGRGEQAVGERARKRGLRLSDSSETWKEFEEQALCFLPTFSPRCSKDESMSAQPQICLLHSPALTEPHLSPKPNYSSSETNNRFNVNSMQLEPRIDHFCSQQQQCYRSKCPFLDRLLVTRVRHDRHTTCCKQIADCSRSCSSGTERVSSDLPRATSRKRVSFVEGSKFVEVHCIVAWQYAYKSCRKGPWEQYARDRMHFRRKIESIAGIIEPCLAKKICHISLQSTT